MTDCLSHCKLALVFAVLMDQLGLISVLLGVFTPLEIQGRHFGDLLVYSGALLVLLSLAAWVMWYSGNIEGLTYKKGVWENCWWNCRLPCLPPVLRDTDPQDSQ